MTTSRSLSTLGISLLFSWPALGSAEPLRLQVWNAMMYTPRQVLREVCDEYEKSHPGVRIQTIYRETEELRSAFQSAAMGGSGPELIHGPSDQVGPFVTMGLLKPLETLFPPDFFAQFDPNAVVRFHGHVYMLGDIVGNHLMLLYNRDLMPRPPADTDEMIRSAKSLTRDLDGDGQVDQWGLVWNFTEPFFYVPWLGATNDWFMVDDVRPNLDTPGNVLCFEFIKSLRDVHRIVPRECDYETANALFKTGRAAMLINGDWSWGDYVQAGVNFGIAPIPRLSQTGRWPTPLISTKGYSVNVNLTDARRLAATRELLLYLTSPEVQLRYTRRASSLPSHLGARKSPIVLENRLLRESAPVMEVGRPMPVVPELRAVWDALRIQYQAVLGGFRQPREAARLSQREALRQIAAMNEVIQPDWQAVAVKVMLGVSSAALLVLLILQLPGLWRSIFRTHTLAWLLILPAFAAVFAIIVFPFVYNILLSFSNFSLRTFNQWRVVGFQQYAAVLRDPLFYTVFLKTVLWTAANLLFHVGLGVFLALLINRTLPAKPLFRVLLIVPWAVPQYITALTWRGMFNQEYGAVNLVLKQFLEMNPVQWLTQPFEAFAACVVTNVWLGFPFMMVVALGGLQSIPAELYEAARVDGAGRWQTFRRITWPMLRPVMAPAITLGAIWTFNNVNVVWLVSNGGEPSDKTHILVSYVYKAAFNLYRYGYGAALSVIIFLILLAFGAFYLHKSKAAESVYE